MSPKTFHWFLTDVDYILLNQDVLKQNKKFKAQNSGYWISIIFLNENSDCLWEKAWGNTPSDENDPIPNVINWEIAQAFKSLTEISPFGVNNLTYENKGGYQCDNNWFVSVLGN